MVAMCIDAPSLADDAPLPQAKEIESIRGALRQVVAELQESGHSNVQGEVETLDALASRCSVLAGKLPAGPKRLEAQNGLLQTRYVQAEHARRQKQDRDAALRVSQLRAAAWQLKRHPDSPAAQIADLWLLQADLFDINRAALDRDHRQRGTIQRLEQFLAVRRAAPVTPQGEQALTNRDIERMLLRLYDQRGRCAKVGQLIEQIKTAEPDNRDLHHELRRQYAYLQRIGKPLPVKVESSNGIEWRLDQPRVGVLLIAFWSPTDTTNPHQLLGELQVDRRGVSMLNVLAGPVTENTDFSAWPQPLCTDQKAVGKLIRLLSVRSVPRMVIVDHDGKVASVGGPAIGDRLDETIGLADKARAAEDTHETEAPQDEPTHADEAAKTDN